MANRFSVAPSWNLELEGLFAVGLVINNVNLCCIILNWYFIQKRRDVLSVCALQVHQFCILKFHSSDKNKGDFLYAIYGSSPSNNGEFLKHLRYLTWKNLLSMGKTRKLWRTK